MDSTPLETTGVVSDVVNGEASVNGVILVFEAGIAVAGVEIVSLVVVVVVLLFVGVLLVEASSAEVGAVGILANGLVIAKSFPGGGGVILANGLLLEKPFGLFSPKIKLAFGFWFGFKFGGYPILPYGLNPYGTWKGFGKSSGFGYC